MRTYEEILQSIEENTKVLNECNELVKKMNEDIKEILEVMNQPKPTFRDRVKGWFNNLFN